MKRLHIPLALLAAGAALAGCGEDKLAIGSPCTQAEECASGQCSADLPGTACTASDCGQCGEGAGCRDWRGAPHCLKSCGGDADCREGYHCFEGLCQPNCSVADDCPAGNVCAEGKCQAKPATGQRCLKDADCATKVCLLPDRTCALGCTSTAACGSGEVCTWREKVDADGDPSGWRGACVARKSGGALGAPCTSGDGCQSGFCNLGLCGEVCSGTTCSNGAACVTSQEPMSDGTPGGVKTCLPARDVLVWDVSAMENDYLGVLPIPGNAISFAIVTQGLNAHYPMVTRLTDPSREVLYDGNGDFFRQPVRYFPQNGINTMMVPINDTLALDRTGAYAFASATYDANGAYKSKPSAKVYYKLGSASDAASGRLDFNVFITRMSGHSCGNLTAANAKTVLAADFAVIKRIYAKAGIEVGTVNYYDITGHPELESFNGDDEAKLNALFQLSAGKSNRAVNLFLVRSLTPFGLLGISGGIPGPPLHGTAHSGIVASWENECEFSWDGTSILGNVLAHEAGHYLGLFHNIEQDNRTTDAISDTTTSDQNLMYWNEEGGESVSNGQGKVLRYNSLVGFK